MLPLFLSLAFVAYCGFTGAAWIFLCRPKAPLLRSWLFSPAVGLSLVVLNVMVLNQAGLPITQFARPLGAGLLLVAAIILKLRRVRLPARALAPVTACLLASLGLAGWPTLSEGFHWVGYGNVDMLGYVFAAQRQMDGGFYDAPNLAALLGLDYTQYYWFYHVPGFVRFGSENTVAFISSVAGLPPLEGFVPAILAIGLMQLSGLAALVLHRGRQRHLAYYATAILSLSPLFQLSLLLQVIAQVGGIALLLAVCGLAGERLAGATFSPRTILQRALLLAPVFAGLMVFYPELLPFCAAVLFLTHLLAGSTWAHFGRILLVAMSTVVFGTIFLRQNLLTGIMTLLFHGGQGTTSAASEISSHPFGLAILPSALPALFGLSSLYNPPPEPGLSMLILLAIGLITLLGALCLVNRRFHEPAIMMFLVMMAVGLSLQLAPNPFGVFKLAMFIQPAMAACLAVAICHLPRILRWVLILVGITVYIHVGQSYLQTMSGITGYGSFLPFHSAEPLDLSRIPPEAKLEADTPSMAYDYLLGLLLRGHDLHFENRDGISGAVGWSLNNDPRNLWPALERILPEKIGRTMPYKAQLDSHAYVTRHLFGAEITELGHSFSEGLFLSVRPPFNHFNKLRELEGDLINHPVFAIRKSADVRNHLIFLNTTRSNDYYSFTGSLGGRAYSYYQNEPDPLRKRAAPFYAIGRFFIFEVKNPDPQIRLRIAFTRSLLGAGRQQLPTTITAQGQDTVTVQVQGAGAANLYTRPLTPVTVDGRYYVAVDLSTEPVVLHQPKSPVMAMFYPSTPLDWRHIGGFGRDISALSEQEYQQMIPPQVLEQFPEGLLDNPALEFSGLYEDGWVSDHARITLGSTKPAATLRLAGEVPLLKVIAGEPKPELIVRINGVESARLPLIPGKLDAEMPIATANARNVIELETTGHFSLPSPDDRPVSFRLLQMRLD